MRFVTPRWLYQSGGRLIHRFRLEWELSNRNDGRGHHFARTAEEKNTLSLLMSTEKPRLVGSIVTPIAEPIVLVVTRVIPTGGRSWDEDSIGRGNAKELIDAMVSAEFLVDDGSKHVKHVTWNQDAVSKPPKSYTNIQFWTGDSYSEVTA